MEHINDKLKPALDQIVFSLVGSKDLCNRWWNSKNKAFDFETPKDVYSKDPQAVKKYLLNMIDYNIGS
jgi:hypothetical protein